MCAHDSIRSYDKRRLAFRRVDLCGIDISCLLFSSGEHVFERWECLVLVLGFCGWDDLEFVKADLFKVAVIGAAQLTVVALGSRVMTYLCKELSSSRRSRGKNHSLSSDHVQGG